ncbi:hypothetical protein TNCV_1736001 [Trichonephila clavipes]|nr:hypothetical protein TNCV_1736001 [Trichonephila clavipes]
MDRLSGIRLRDYKGENLVNEGEQEVTMGKSSKEGTGLRRAILSDMMRRGRHSDTKYHEHYPFMRFFKITVPNVVGYLNSVPLSTTPLQTTILRQGEGLVMTDLTGIPLSIRQVFSDTTKAGDHDTPVIGSGPSPPGNRGLHVCRPSSKLKLRAEASHGYQYTSEAFLASLFVPKVTENVLNVIVRFHTIMVHVSSTHNRKDWEKPILQCSWSRCSTNMFLFV